MARRKTLPESLRAKLDLAERLTALRLELFGERGGPEMARRLGIPVRTWYNYEGGVTVPAEVVLRIIELTSVEPGWLLRGKGPKFRPAPRADRLDPASQPAVMVGALLRTALQLLEGHASPELGFATARFLESGRTAIGDGAPAGDSLAAPGSDHDNHVLDRAVSHREWLEARREGRCVSVVDDSMAPVLVRGSTVAFAPEEEGPALLDGRMVVAWIEGEPVVRWFEDRGDHGVLRAQDAGVEPLRFTLEGSDAPSVRRVLWIGSAR